MKNNVTKAISAILVILMLAVLPVTAFAAGVSSAKAQDIALADSNVQRSQAKFTKTKLDVENGENVYEIEFTVETASSVTRYEYEISAATGRIVDKDKETKSKLIPAAGTGITKSEAIAIALNNAGIKKAKALKLSAKKDREAGKSVYEVTFYVRNNGRLIEYDYTILISNGTILEKETEVEAVAPAKVSGLRAQTKTAASVTLKWNRVKRAVGYIVYKYNASTKKYTKIAVTKSLTYKVTGLKADTAYGCAVRANIRDEGIAPASTSYAKINVRTAK